MFTVHFGVMVKQLGKLILKLQWSRSINKQYLIGPL